MAVKLYATLGDFSPNSTLDCGIIIICSSAVVLSSLSFCGLALNDIKVVGGRLDAALQLFPTLCLNSCKTRILRVNYIVFNPLKGQDAKWRKKSRATNHQPMWVCGISNTEWQIIITLPWLAIKVCVERYTILWVPSAFLQLSVLGLPHRISEYEYFIDTQKTPCN
jgi:hypothetical protein